MAKVVEETVQGQAGGLAVVQQRGSSYMAEIGRRGGKAVVKKYGRGYMSLLGTIANDNVNENLSKTGRIKVERSIRRILREKA
jgi:hypothetical protein